MCSPLFLPKESSHKFAVVFVNVLHFLGDVRRTIVSNRKACESPFSSLPFRLRGFQLVRQQRQDKYRGWYSVKPLVIARVHVAERVPADELLTAS